VDIVEGDEDVAEVETGVDEVEGAFGIENGDEIGEGGEGGGNSKISTTFVRPLLLVPPPKNILF
jgi:hypothetical protein